MQIDPPPHVLKDEVGFKLVNPEEGWRDRPDMHPQGTAPFRASIVARARFVEDYVTEKVQHGIHQYVLLGSGLDTFAQRSPEISSKLDIYEIEKSETLNWKRQRLLEIGYAIPSRLHFVPVNFESSIPWWDQLAQSGFKQNEKAIVTSMGVSMYLTHAAIGETLSHMAKLAPGSTFIMTFMLPLEMVNPEDKQGYEFSIKGAARSGTPFISFFKPEEMLTLAKKAGFKQVEHFSTTDLIERYFSQRSDGLRPSSGEEFLIAST